MRILYNSRDARYKTPFGTLEKGELCCQRIEIPAEIRTVRVELVLLREDGSDYRTVPMQRESAQELYECYSCTWSGTEPGLYFYYFRITTANECFRLLKQGNDTNMESGDLWQVSVLDGTFPVPEALQGAVMYQIFPDRFHKAGQPDLQDKLQPYWVHENLSDVPEYRPDAEGITQNNDFYGGNLQGILEKLPYLRRLGVDILYLNPIFMAYSSHRYDTCDFLRIDPMLGTEEDFRELCERAHAFGMKIVLDGVFSHVGNRSVYFQSAISDPDSPYRSWFRFEHYPDRYAMWWEIRALPAIDKTNEDYIRFIIENEDSVVARWLRLGADGFRLDVVDELPDAFVLRLRRRIRELNPQAILIGEVWEDASNKVAYGVRRRYFSDGELDSVMNYPWQKSILQFVRGEDDGTSFGESVMTLAENYPPDVLQSVMNILSTHDTARALTALVDPTDADREELAKRRLSGEDIKRGKDLLRMAAFLQFVLPGMACIYYGDEAGMDGYRDPFNRMYYPWGDEDVGLQSFYRGLAELKKCCAPIRRGTVEVLQAGGGRILMRRRLGGQSVLLAACRSEERWSLAGGKLLLGGGLQEVLPDRVTLGSMGFCAIQEA